MLNPSQKIYRIFLALNLVSFTCVTGDVVNLYLLNLGASASVIGIINSFWYATFLFSIWGRYLVPRFGLVKTRAMMWFLRYVLIAPMLLAVIPVVQHSAYVFQIIGLSVVGFNVAKGMAIVGDRMVLSSFTTNNNRTHYLAGCQVQQYILGLLIRLCLAILFSYQLPLYVFALVMGNGILFGMVAALTYSRLPEPEAQSKQGRPGSHFSPLLPSLRGYWRYKPFRLILVITFVVSWSIPALLSFVIVYLKQVYFASDGEVLGFSFGVQLSMILFSMSLERLMRYAKIKGTFSLLGLAAILAILLIWAAELLPYPIWALWLVGLVFVVLSTCQQGLLVVTDMAFYSVSPKGDFVNAGICLNLVRGIAGLLGSIAAGYFIDLLQFAGLNKRLSLECFFALSFLTLLLALYWMRFLPRCSR